MLPGSAATHWNYTFLCARLMQHFVDIYLGLKFFQDVCKVHREDFLLSLYCLWPLQQWMNTNLYWSPKQTAKEQFSWKISLQHVLVFYISSRPPSSI